MVTEKIYPKLTPGQKVYGTFESADILDFDRFRLRDFMKKGLISFGVTVAYGENSHRTVFNRKELYRLKLLDRFLKMGVKRSLAAQVIERLNRDDLDPNLTGWIIFSGFDSYKSAGKVHYTPIMGSGRNPDSLLKVLRDLDVNLVINIREIIRDVDEKIKAYQAIHGKKTKQ